MFCLDKIKEEDKKGEALKNKKSNKYASLKRLESSAKKFGAMVGFTAMALLMGGFGSIAVGSAFTIQNSLTMQEE